MIANKDKLMATEAKLTNTHFPWEVKRLVCALWFVFGTLLCCFSFFSFWHFLFYLKLKILTNALLTLLYVVAFSGPCKHSCRVIYFFFFFPPQRGNLYFPLSFDSNPWFRARLTGGHQSLKFISGLRNSELHQRAQRSTCWPWVVSPVFAGGCKQLKTFVGVET